MKKKIVIIGGGGHAKVVIDAIKRAGEFNIRGVVDAKLKPGEFVLGVTVIGSDEILPKLFKEGAKYAFIGVGSIGDCSVRKELYDNLKRIGFKLSVISHPKAVIAKDVELGEGTFVAAGAVINPGTKIGKNVIINTSASVDHDCKIGDFVHIAPRATLSGGVKIGDETHVGTGANIIQCLVIGKKCMIGAGATVRKNVEDEHKFLGKISLLRDEKQWNKKVFIIAEAGVNHNGSLEIAKEMVDAAADAGADAVKFQTFKAEKIISRFAPKADYQKGATDWNESQLDMVKKLELDRGAHKELIYYCKEKGIMFLSSPFDLKSIDLLKELGLEIFKIPSGEITNLPYLRKIGSLKKKVIISTGMADLEEIKKALDILTQAGTQKENITVLHCNTEYPTPYKDANLLAMLTIKEAFKVNVGYSDHTPGVEVPAAAAALGAGVIEKHFTLDKNMQGPDHKTSLEPDELKAMVRIIRNIEKAIGNGIKQPAPSELKNKSIVRKSVVAAGRIKKGEIFTEENLAFKRPGDGISPMELDSVIGKTAKKGFSKDETIEL